MIGKHVNVSTHFIWLAVKNTHCSLLRKPNGIGDLTTCLYNPVGIQNQKYSVFTNSKHLGVSINKFTKCFNVYHKVKRNSNKPAKCFQHRVIYKFKRGIEKFKKFVRYQLGRRDLSSAIIKKVNRIMITNENKFAKKSIAFRT